VLTDGYYCYVDAPDATRTFHAQHAAIDAVVLLQREVGGARAQLVDVPVEDAVLNTMLRDTRHAFNAEKTLSGYCDLLKATKACRLIYSDWKTPSAAWTMRLSNGPISNLGQARPGLPGKTQPGAYR
jgi:hypothetical protein